MPASPPWRPLEKCESEVSPSRGRGAMIESYPESWGQRWAFTPRAGSLCSSHHDRPTPTLQLEDVREGCP